jgi:hypothetical protein
MQRHAPMVSCFIVPALCVLAVSPNPGRMAFVHSLFIGAAAGCHPVVMLRLNLPGQCCVGATSRSCAGRCVALDDMQRAGLMQRLFKEV